MRTLVAGLGNIFHGDDGIGVAVAEALACETLPDGVTVRDYGIRGVHLAYELLDGYDLVVLVDAVQRGWPPGTVRVIEHVAAERSADPLLDAHDMAPDEVLALVPALGGTLGRVVVVGCEIESLTPCGQLSAAVQAAVPDAVAAVLRIVGEAYDGEAYDSDAWDSETSGTARPVRQRGQWDSETIGGQR
jgi:hydrogenase maturation protease